MAASAKVVAALAAARAAKAEKARIESRFPQREVVNVSHDGGDVPAKLSGSGMPFVPKIIKKSIKEDDAKAEFFQPGKVLFYSIAPGLEIVLGRVTKRKIEMKDGRFDEEKVGRRRVAKFINHRYWCRVDDVPALRGDADGPHHGYGTWYLEALPLDSLVPVPADQTTQYAWIKSLSEMLDNPKYELTAEGFLRQIEEKSDKKVRPMRIMKEIGVCVEEFSKWAEAQQKLAKAV